MSGDYVSARDYFERALHLSDDTRPALINDPSTAVGFVNCTGFLGCSLWLLGYPEQARKQHARLLDLLGGPIGAYTRGLGIIFELIMSDFMRDNPRMLEAAQRLIALARESGLPYYWAPERSAWVARWRWKEASNVEQKPSPRAEKSYLSMVSWGRWTYMNTLRRPHTWQQAEPTRASRSLNG